MTEMVMSGLVRGVEKRARPREICGNIQRQRALLLLNAFLGRDARPCQSCRDYGLEIKSKVYQWTGVPFYVTGNKNYV